MLPWRHHKPRKLPATSPEKRLNAAPFGSDLTGAISQTIAFGFNSVKPILAQGAALSDVPMLAGFDEDITAAVADGATVEIDPAAKTLTVIG